MRNIIFYLLFAVIISSSGFSFAQTVFTVISSNDPTIPFDSDPSNPSAEHTLRWAIKSANLENSSIINLSYYNFK